MNILQAGFGLLLLFSGGTPTSTPLEVEKLYNEVLIRQYAVQYEVNEELAVNIAIAESNLITNARNKLSTASGIYQWISSSWNSICRPLGFEDVFNPKENIECAIITIKEGAVSHWNASREVWSKKYDGQRKMVR